MEVGLTNGLAVDFGADKRIQESRGRFLMLQEAQNVAEQKAKLQAEELKMPTQMNAFDDPIIKAHGLKTIQALGEYTQNNPDWKFSYQKRAIYNQMRDSILNNEHVARAQATQKNMAEMDKAWDDSTKNPHGYNKQAYDKYQEERKNYLQFGHQLGPEAAATEGPKAFTFQKPEDFIDLAEENAKLGNTIHNYDVIDLPGTHGGFYTQAKKDDIEALALSRYKKNKYQIDLDAAAKGVDPMDLTREQINAGFHKTHSMGDIDYGLKLAQLDLEKQKMAMSKQDHAEDRAIKMAKLKGTGGKPYTTWHSFLDQPVGDISSEVVANTWGPRPKISIKGTPGSKEIDLTGNEFHAYAHQTVHGVKNIVGYVDIPADQAKDLGIAENPLGWNDTAVKTEYGQNAKMLKQKDKDGKEQKVIRITTVLPINKDDQVAQKLFEGQTMVSKHIPMTEDPGYGQPAEIPTYSKSDLLSNGWNEEKINLAVQKGLINVQ